MIKRLLNRDVLVTVGVLLVASLTLTSCESLRKKFTRKKKEGQVVDFQPVLEPEDYPAPEKNPQEMYKQHYALIKVWYRDLWSGIEDKRSTNDSSVQYSLKQIMDHIEDMKTLLKPEKAEGLNKLTDLLKSYRDALNQPRPARNYSRVQSDLRSFFHLLKTQFGINAVQGDLIK